MHSLPMCLTMFNILLNMYSNVHLMVVYFANNPVSSHVAHELCPLSSLHQSSYSLLIILLNQNSFTITDCKPKCKFGVCNTTTGQCDCPSGRTGADCDKMRMLINIYTYSIHVVNMIIECTGGTCAHVIT